MGDAVESDGEFRQVTGTAVDGQRLGAHGCRVALACLVLLAGCGDDDSGGGGADAGGADAGGADAAATTGKVHVVLFTHIEDNTPAGTLGSAQSRTGYLNLRGKLLEMGRLARSHDLSWVLQPDWKYLEAALLYEDAATMADTGGKNLFRYLRDDLGVAIDPHSHENGGYNYTDVAELLTRLEVGGSTVIGGHIWDPALPQFQQWDRFRTAVAGMKYPSASWRGDILIGAGTPNHVNDPLVSGAWRPRDRDSYFVDDPTGNILAFGAWHDQVTGVQELVDLYARGVVAPGSLLTAGWNIQPTVLTASGGLAMLESTVLVPLAALRDQGKVVSTDYTTLAATWRTAYGAVPTIYKP